MPARPRFIQSQTLDNFKRELLAYINQEISGRSFLISGHRGAGKTALSARAVDDISRKVIQDLIKDDRVEIRRPAGLQRPLLVRIHGPSLLTRELPGPGDSKSSPHSNGPVAGPLSTQAYPNAPSAVPTDEVHSALVQIMIALYRALATEIASAFTTHARAEHRLRPDDQLELASQFTLELDQAPEPATLRAYWERLGRLAPGILWPRQVGKRLQELGFADQGFREITALAVAAQAFQVCTGNVEYSLTKKDANSSTVARESRTELNLKGLLTGLLGLILGGPRPYWSTSRVIIFLHQSALA